MTMSIKSWKKEFYPIKANECPKSEAEEHSLQKWKGLEKKNLKKHKVWLDGSYLFDDEETFMFTEKNCALCFHHYNNHCTTCPLAVSLGNIPCYCENMPYGILCYDVNPKPMIKVLKKLVKNKND